MDKLKTYFVEVVLKKVTSAGMQSAVSALVVFLAAHQNYLESIGITTFSWGQWPNAVQPSGPCTLIEWDTLKLGGSAALFAGVMLVVAWSQHHVVATVTGKPQSGDMRVTPEAPIVGGERKIDEEVTPK